MFEGGNLFLAIEEQLECEVIKKFKKLNKDWNDEPGLHFLMCISRITVEQILEYCLERTNHYVCLEEYKKDIQDKVDKIHKRNMEVIDNNLNRLFV